MFDSDNDSNNESNGSPSSPLSTGVDPTFTSPEDLDGIGHIYGTQAGEAEQTLLRKNGQLRKAHVTLTTQAQQLKFDLQECNEVKTELSQQLEKEKAALLASKQEIKNVRAEAKESLRVGNEANTRAHFADKRDKAVLTIQAKKLRLVGRKAQASLDILEAEHADLKSQFAEQKAELAAVKQERNTLAAALTSVKDELKTVKAQRDSLTSELAASQAQNILLQEQLREQQELQHVEEQATRRAVKSRLVQEQTASKEADRLRAASYERQHRQHEVEMSKIETEFAEQITLQEEAYARRRVALAEATAAERCHIRSSTFTTPNEVRHVNFGGGVQQSTVKTGRGTTCTFTVNE